MICFFGESKFFTIPHCALLCAVFQKMFENFREINWFTNSLDYLNCKLLTRFFFSMSRYIMHWLIVNCCFTITQNMNGILFDFLPSKCLKFKFIFLLSASTNLSTENSSIIQWYSAFWLRSSLTQVKATARSKWQKHHFVSAIGKIANYLTLKRGSLSLFVGKTFDTI